MARKIEQEYIIGRRPEVVFDALVRPGLIRKWWSAHTAIVLPETGGIYAVTWGDDADYPDYISVADIAVFERPARLLLTGFRYKSKEGGLPFEARMDTEFRLEALGTETRFTVRQTGFPDDAIADDFYNGCVQGWTDTCTSFKKTVEEQL